MIVSVFTTNSRHFIIDKNSFAGIFKLLIKLTPNKACPDGIPLRLQKETAYQMAPLAILTYIFHQDWKSILKPSHQSTEKE